MATATKTKSTKRATRKPKQKALIPDALPKIPETLQNRCDDYVETLRNRQSMQAEEGVIRAEIIEMMNRHGIQRIPLEEGDGKSLVLVAGKSKIKIVADGKEEDE